MCFELSSLSVILCRARAKLMNIPISSVIFIPIFDKYPKHHQMVNIKMQSFNIDSSCQTIAICFPHCFYMNRFWNEWIFESTNDFSHEYFLFLLPSKNYPLVNNSSWMFVKNVSYIPLIISRALNPLRSFDFCHLSYQLRLIYSNILGQQK